MFFCDNKLIEHIEIICDLNRFQISRIENKTKTHFMLNNVIASAFLFDISINILKLYGGQLGFVVIRNGLKSFITTWMNSSCIKLG